VSKPEFSGRTIVLYVFAMIAATALTIEGTYLILNAYVLHDPSDPLTKAGGCHLSRRRAGSERLMNTTYPQPRNRKSLKRPWTADEDARLQTLLAAGTSVALVAAKLKRTVKGVTSRCRKFGLSLARRGRGT
jgi:hypothetical protein